MSTNRAIHLKVLERSERPLDLAAQSFMLSREAMRCTEATLIWYRKYVGALVTYLTERGITAPEQVKPDTLRAYLVYLQGRGLADRTIHHHASAARALFTYLTAEGLIGTNPMAKVKMPRLPHDVLPALTQDEVRRILAVCRTSRDTAIVLCLLDTGCRSSEFLALNIGDVEVGNGTVHVRQGKGRKDRVTFLGAKARKALIKHLMERKSTHPSDPLWLNNNTGERLGRDGLGLLLNRLGRTAGVEHCHPHTFRRTFALWSLRSGMNVYALQQIMGHSDLTVLRRYLALVEEDLADAHRKHGAVDNML